MTDQTPPHRRSPMEHERDACPLGKDCDLTIAWLAGAESKHDEMQARIEALEAERDRLREIIREAHDAMKDGADATAWAFLHAALKGEGE